MEKNTALQIFSKRLTDKGLWGVVAALALELASTGQIKPGLKMLGYREYSSSVRSGWHGL